LLGVNRNHPAGVPLLRIDGHMSTVDSSQRCQLLLQLRVGYPIVLFRLGRWHGQNARKRKRRKEPGNQLSVDNVVSHGLGILQRNGMQDKVLRRAAQGAFVGRKSSGVPEGGAGLQALRMVACRSALAAAVALSGLRRSSSGYLSGSSR